MKNNYNSHPWHGISPGKNSPEEVTVFIEITPFDTMKYELDKESGLLKVDRPQKFSNIVPALYGFVPQTYCGEKIMQLSRNNGTDATKGDGDPLDILVLCSHHITHGNILLQAIPIGGFGLIDKGEADDKVIAVMVGDQTYGEIRDVSELSKGVLNRLRHYFLTYKNLPDVASTCRIDYEYGAAEAKKVIIAATEDYKDTFL